MDRTDPTWSRGDGQPDRRRLDRALDRLLDCCDPVEVLLFGSGARGELRQSSDIDLLVVLADGDLDLGRVRLDVCRAIGYQPRADVVLALERDVRRYARALASVLRVARDEGVVLYCRGRRHPYQRRPRPPATDGRCPDSAAVREEADWLWGLADRELHSAEWWASLEGTRGTRRTEIAGRARKAVELALQTAIERCGRRPRAWKDPAGLASEARAAGMPLPPVDRGALERAANYYTGGVYPFYPSPSAAEAFEALELARRLVPWARPPRVCATGRR